MNLKGKNAPQNRRIARDEGKRTLKVSCPNDAERALIILEGTAEAQNAVLLQLFHIGEMPL